MTEDKPIPDVLDAAHFFAGRALRTGDTAVDATVGNGHDTQFLAEQVGPAGRVVGFDVQEQALHRTRKRVGDLPQGPTIDLIHAGHECMPDHLPGEMAGEVSTVMFNLGYLPGSDSSRTTQPETTLEGVAAALEMLRPGGVVTIVLYTGHDGGAEETRAVRDWVQRQPQEQVRALSYRFMNQRNDPPQLVVLEKPLDEEKGPF